MQNFIKKQTILEKIKKIPKIVIIIDDTESLI